MNSLQINCFLEAAKCKNFSVAATNLFVSQPTLSRNVSILEKELNVKLFQRSTFHGIKLTTAGIIMQNAFLSAKEIIEAGMEEADSILLQFLLIFL